MSSRQESCSNSSPYPTTDDTSLTILFVTFLNRNFEHLHDYSSDQLLAQFNFSSASFVINASVDIFPWETNSCEQRAACLLFSVKSGRICIIQSGPLSISCAFQSKLRERNPSLLTSSFSPLSELILLSIETMSCLFKFEKRTPADGAVELEVRPKFQTSAVQSLCVSFFYNKKYNEVRCA